MLSKLIKYVLIFDLFFSLSLANADVAIKTIPAFSGEFSTEKALEIMFGNFDPAVPRACDKCISGGSTWSPDEVCSSSDFIQLGMNQDDSRLKFFLKNLEYKDGPAIAQVYSMHPYKIDNKEMMYLVLQTESNSCSACEAILGISSWERSADNWKLVSSNKCLTTIGGAGWLVGNGELVKISDSDFGLLFRRPYNDWESAILIVNDEGVLRVVFSDVIADGNSNGRDSCHDLHTYCWKYSSTFSFEKNPKTKYYDMLQKTIGTKKTGYDSKKRIDIIIPYNQTFRYKFSDGKYVK